MATEVRTEPVFDALKQPLALIDNDERRRQTERKTPPEAAPDMTSVLVPGGVADHVRDSRARLSSAELATTESELNAIAAAVIGGTSLFGGRGSAYSALLGIIVIQAISNGLTLLNLSSSLRYMILGGVLALAVIVDSLARRSRASHGR